MESDVKSSEEPALAAIKEKNDDQRIKEPIFIIGSGRCGSTIFHKIFARHHQVAWLSKFCDQYPRKPEINRWLMKAIDLPLFGKKIITKYDPDECYIFWENMCRGFSEPCRDLTEDDVTASSRKKVHETMQKVLTTKRDRLLIKITGWSRMGFINEIFPDARFIHVLRDGRAVVNSLMNVAFWSGWKGPHNWRWGMLNEEQERVWKKYDESFAILAAIEWKMQIDAIEKARKTVPDSRFMEIRYEDFMSEPVKTFEEVTGFCELEWTPEFRSQIESFDLKNMNYKWKENLPESQKEMLGEFLDDYLSKNGYK